MAIYFIVILVIGLVGTEIAKIDYKNGPQNRILQKTGGQLLVHHFKGLYRYDDVLGWAPQDHASVPKWDTTVNIGKDGIRLNGKPQDFDEERPLAIAFGGSFTFGDCVGDDQTWPAHLDKLVSYRVWNAGVSSYGIDQAVLRAEQLIRKYRPQKIIVSMIRASRHRAFVRVRHGVPKPYFAVENNALVLKNVPVPFKESAELDPFRKMAGYSYFMNKWMDTFFSRVLVA